jgi:dienelactone hydrolase
MTYNTRHLTSGINLPNLLTLSLAAIGMVVLLSGFTVTEVEFNSMDVPPSKFKIRQAKQKGLPAPEGVPGLSVKATLTKPEGKGPFPAIVMFSTAGGWQDTPRHWRKRLNAWGYVTLEVGAENEFSSNLQSQNQVLDAIGALEYLQEIPYVDSNRVAVMGWDLGAETALWAIDALGWAGKHKNRFVAAVAIYPACELIAAGQFFSPALIITAELDGLAKPSSCERLVKSVPSGLNVPIQKIMPDAYHWFDLPHRPDLTSYMHLSQTYDMTYKYNAKATEAAVNHVRSFLEANF